MNIHDHKIDEASIPANIHDIMKEIFDHQTTLCAKYIDIERTNGFFKPDLPGIPAHGIGRIDDKQFQNWLKNMFWRVTEEVSEAYEVSLEIEMGGDAVKMLPHFLEEMIDALHFFVEASIMVGYTPANATPAICKGVSKPTQHAWAVMSGFIFQLGITANCLKNKPWKVTHMLTDRSKFWQLLDNCWVDWGRLMTAMKMSDREMYRLYMQKNAVNKFRQNTKY